MLATTVNVVPRSDHFAKATYCRTFFLCQRSAGDLPDKMGNASAVKFDGGYTDGEAWANPGYLTTANSAVTDYMTRPANAGHDFDCTQVTAVVALRLKKTTPGSNETIMGCFTSGSANGGWQVIATSTGTVQLQLKPLDGGTATTLTIGSSYAPLDGSERLLVWFVPRDAVSAQMFVDGAAAGTSGMAAAVNNFAGGNTLSIGAAHAGSAKVAQFATIQIYTITKDLAALKTQQIAGFMARHPHRPVPNWLFEA